MTSLMTTGALTAIMSAPGLVVSTLFGDSDGGSQGGDGGSSKSSPELLV